MAQPEVLDVAVKEENPQLGLSNLSFRERVVIFQKQVDKLPQVMTGAEFYAKYPLKYKYSDGFYIFEMFIPKGMLLIGKIHKHAHPSFFMKGKMIVVTEDEGIKELEAPMNFISPKGTKRVGIALEDTIWCIVFPSDDPDVEKVRKDIFFDSYEEFDNASK